MARFFDAEQISKTYPGVKANDQIKLSIDAGEIHALLGENGSGKSTLVKIIYGLLPPDEGKMLLNGQRYRPQSPRQARAEGVAMVFQHFSLFEALTVAENIELGMDDPPSRNKLEATIDQIGQRYRLPILPRRIVGDLSVGERQRVEIIRCLMQNPKLLIMDEPTSVLTPQEADQLFETLNELSHEGTSILYISHKLEEIRNLCTRATILRLGKVVNVCNPKSKSAQELAELMVGTNFATASKGSTVKGSEPLLCAENLSCGAVTEFGVSLSDVNFEVKKGEILGIAGVAGNGQEELAAVIAGEAKATGSLRFKGSDLLHKRITERRELGLLTAPEERLGHSAASEMSLTENAFLTADQRMALSSSGVIDWKKTKDFTRSVISQFDVRATGADSPARALSGGNLQKFVIGREIAQKPEALVVNQPTWGVDAAAAAIIRQALIDLASKGAAVLVISQDLDELLEISSSIAVLNLGQLSAAKNTDEITRNEIGLLMGGVHGPTVGSETTVVAA
ncbi:MAG: ABC transporter ATP-binding protein [Aestuariivita sp.]|nr:ABC transporter ATP-binding protein [Aestuariivita sp.]MCY4347696.1 ABC transporter ATP-binding protein [Aestuariivita sp.]